jgi:hypothetical protein
MYREKCAVRGELPVKPGKGAKCRRLPGKTPEPGRKPRTKAAAAPRVSMRANRHNPD